MKLKLNLVVASMSVLGFVSCPVFAADATTETSAPTTQTAAPKPHHHKMMHHHKKQHHTVATEEVAHHDYKDMALPAPVCTVSQTSLVMEEMTQNVGRSLPNPCNPGWFNRINVSGGVNVDIGKWGNLNPGYMGESYQRFALNDAYLNVSAVVNDWAKAFASISYMNATTVGDNGYGVGIHPGEYSAAYANNVGDYTSNNSLQLEQAYMTLGNFDVSPFFVQVGKQFQDFGRYEIHPITRSMTQVMSETLATSAKVGFIANGFNGSVYAFNDQVPKLGHNTKTVNYGGSLGYDAPSDTLGWDVGVGYLYNLIGVNDIAYAVQNFTHNDGYDHRVSGAAVYGDVNSGPFSISARYTSALQRFNATDLASHVKPWAAGIQAGYGFEMFGCRSNNLYVGYQVSNSAWALNLPKNRWLVGYGIDVWKWTNVALEWDHDQGYGHHHHITDVDFAPVYATTHHFHRGSNDSTNLVTLRASVEFM